MRTLIKLIIGLAILAMIAILAYNRFGPSDEAEDTGPVAVAPPPSKAEPQFPVPAPAADPTPAEDPPADDTAAPETAAPPPPEPPPLADSDEAAAESLRALFDASLIDAILRPRNLIRHIVVTIDNLDRAPIPLRFRPIEPVAGEFEVDGGDQFTTTSPGNAQRYRRHVQAFTSVPADTLVDTYFFYYPLFQQAYEDLGYPDSYFNDRLIGVIDHLLATPEVSYPIALKRPSVFYEFKSERLEKTLSFGQKALIRLGPAQAAAVKRQLRAIRTEIAARAAD